MDEILTKLSQLFDKGFDINEELKVSSLSTNDTNFQKRVSEGIKTLEESTLLVNELSLFSSNESVEEIATKTLKYLLLPAILGDLTLKSMVTERSEVLQTAEIYFNDYIQRLNDYQICDIDIKRDDSSEKESSESKTITSSMASLESAAHNRNDKIRRYNQTKQLDNKLNEMRQNMSQTVEIDDEIQREYYLLLINRWINHSLEELASIEMEKPILKHMKEMKALNKDSKQSVRTKSDSPRLKPIIIARNEVQKKIYGLGYPSIPTVTVDDFVNQKLKEGTLSITDPNIYSNNLIDWAQNPDQKLLEDESEEERKEGLIQRDDPIALQKARNWDDWKDDHKRGEGNRKNMG